LDADSSKNRRRIIENYLVISDLQIPFELDDGLRFCRSVQKEFKIPKENIIIIGDETDQYFASRFSKDPDADLSPTSEIKAARDRLKHWVSAFPIAQVCISNHGLRWLSRAFECNIPTELIIPYKELFNLPDSWIYKEEWRFKTKHPFRAIHGMGYSGMNGARNACVDGQISTVIGHLHSHAGVDFIKTNNDKWIWGMNVGCLIDAPSFAFKYGKYSRYKPMLSVGVILDNGKTPVVVPYDKNT
jgi:hypothetical protein